MPTETLLPDALVNGSVYFGAFADVDEGCTSPNDSDSIALNNTAHYYRCSFPTPSAPPKVGAGLQVFRVRALYGFSPTSLLVSRSEGGGSPVSIGSQALTTSFTTYSFGWDASALGNPDGSAVEIYLKISASNLVYILAFDWVVDLAVAPGGAAHQRNYRRRHLLRR